MKLSELIEELLRLEEELGNTDVFLLEVNEEGDHFWNAEISEIEVRTDKDNKKIIVIF
jgi:hypothetical protein